MTDELHFYAITRTSLLFYFIENPVETIITNQSICIWEYAAVIETLGIPANLSLCYLLRYTFDDATTMF